MYPGCNARCLACDPLCIQVALVDFPEGVEGSASKNDNAVLTGPNPYPSPSPSPSPNPSPKPKPNPNQVLTAAAEQLRELHPEMFKSSAK